MAGNDSSSRCRLRITGEQETPTSSRGWKLLLPHDSSGESVQDLGFEHLNPSR